MRPQQASRTALLIAASLLLQAPAEAGDHAAAGAGTDPLPARCRRAFLGAAPWPWPWLARHAHRPLLRRAAALLERLTLPGIQQHYRLRKQLLRIWAEQALAAPPLPGEQSARQLVLLGAGLDTLALELARAHPGLPCIELDHPASQALKRGVLRAQGLDPGLDLRFAAADLAVEPLGPALARAGFQPGLPTLFVAEGLLMYLPPARLRQQLAELRSLCPQGRLAFSFMAPDARGRARFASARPWLQAWLAWVGEPFLWCARPEALAAQLAGAGLRVRELAGHAELRRQFCVRKGAGSPAQGAVCEGEVLMLCDWGWPGLDRPAQGQIDA